MTARFRLGPRRTPALCLLVLLCWLSLTVAAAGAPPDQYLVRRAEITLSVADAGSTAAGLEALARTVRGRFAGAGIRTFDLSDGLRGVEATLELPPEMLDTALARLRGMALLVLSEKVESRDVGGQVDELNQRLEQLRVSRRQLRDLIKQAETNSERWQVETALSQVEAEIADVEATLAALRQDADWATIHILAHEAPSPLPTSSSTPQATIVPVTLSPTPWHPGKTAKQATNVLLSLVRELTDVLIVLAIVGGPFLMVGLVGRWIVGRMRG